MFRSQLTELQTLCEETQQQLVTSKERISDRDARITQLETQLETALEDKGNNNALLVDKALHVNSPASPLLSPAGVDVERRSFFASPSAPADSLCSNGAVVANFVDDVVDRLKSFASASATHTLMPPLELPDTRLNTEPGDNLDDCAAGGGIDSITSPEAPANISQRGTPSPATTITDPATPATLTRATHSDLPAISIRCATPHSRGSEAGGRKRSYALAVRGRDSATAKDMSPTTAIINRAAAIKIKLNDITMSFSKSDTSHRESAQSSNELSRDLFDSTIDNAGDTSNRSARVSGVSFAEPNFYQSRPSVVRYVPGKAIKGNNAGGPEITDRKDVNENRKESCNTSAVNKTRKGSSGAYAVTVHRKDNNGTSVINETRQDSNSTVVGNGAARKDSNNTFAAVSGRLVTKRRRDGKPPRAARRGGIEPFSLNWSTIKVNTGSSYNFSGQQQTSQYNANKKGGGDARGAKPSVAIGSPGSVFKARASETAERIAAALAKYTPRKSRMRKHELSHFESPPPVMVCAQVVTPKRSRHGDDNDGVTTSPFQALLDREITQTVIKKEVVTPPITPKNTTDGDQSSLQQSPFLAALHDQSCSSGSIPSRSFYKQNHVAAVAVAHHNHGKGVKMNKATELRFGLGSSPKLASPRQKRRKVNTSISSEAFTAAAADFRVSFPVNKVKVSNKNKRRSKSRRSTNVLEDAKRKKKSRYTTGGGGGVGAGGARVTTGKGIRGLLNRILK